LANLEDGCTAQTIEQGKTTEIDTVNARFLCFREDSDGYAVAGVVKLPRRKEFQAI